MSHFFSLLLITTHMHVRPSAICSWLLHFYPLNDVLTYVCFTV